ncbi:DEAD/DEAH box helicase family protein [Algoriphagus halophytocola]|uniref:DEAD/DEAH box helicase family protein n=1 Tax=Algoriphagus halophytocola TaxID=2991499 RepID=A0ABY6MGM6_9BACT|nr:DEAD/DEAH box helicase family protein [Algoriphagus sp. TR-M5]UZD21796.1 DEAD/DEAH box helicase family protein [Algoriphagus sp. TR-M5]
MLKDVLWPEDRSYRTSSEDEPFQFYLEGLSHSNRLDLLLGYFSSGAIHVLALGFAHFLSKGGKVRMVINNILSSEDKNALSLATEKDTQFLNRLDLSDVRKLRTTLSDYNRHFFECLAWLIANERIQIVVIKPKGKHGISHFKSGTFYDRTDYVGFKASCNFTAFGLLENLEELDAFLGWENSRSSKMINRNLKVFENYFNKVDETVEYLDSSEITEVIKSEFSGKTEQELLIQESELLEKKSIILENNKLRRKIELLVKEIETIAREPRFPYSSGPREYQVEAYKNWVSNNYHGIFAMATGTGKTITSLNCLLEEYNKTKTYYGIILVPSKALLDQWISEVSLFNFGNIIAVGGGHNGMELLPNFASNFKAGLKKDIIIITTYASFSSGKFQKTFSKIQDSFILIADEAHNMGAIQIKEVMAKLTIQKRIGLSATPKRKYDPEGTDAICQFFNDQPPFCYNFGMKRAMAEGRLTDYYYYPRIVNLDEDEKEEYVELSNALLKFFDFEKGQFKDSPIVERLLLKRKTIIHQARRKIPAYKEILRELDQKDKLQYVFTYVPVGSSKEEENDNDKSNKFVYQYLKAAQEVKPSLKASTYTSETDDRVGKIRAFSEGKVDMLLAMKMLDEGVDIPRTEIGIFASSTGNPREYIQRRGRLLRNHDDKKFAYVYDMIVAPVASYDNENLYRIEKNMVRNELIRVAYFASLSMNFYDSKDILQDICDRYELDLDVIINELEND